MSDLLHLLKQWRASRLEYPGWVVTPEDNREELWRYTENWIHPIAKGLAGIPAPENLFLLYELNWRLERTLWPLFIDAVHQITSVLETFAILPRALDLPNAKYRPTATDFQHWDWKEIGVCWIELAFAVTREAREDLDTARHQLWLERLQTFSAFSPDTAARIHYEKALFRLWELDYRGLREVLHSWPAAPEQPFWEARRAALLAEAGRLGDTVSITEQALDTVRLRQTPGREDITLLSQEGWIVNLLSMSRQGSKPHLIESQETFQDRYTQLGHFRCNPWSILEPLQLRLRYARPQIIPPAEEIKDFDPGYVSIRRHGLPGLDREELRAGFALLRLFEEAAMPMHIGIVSNSTEAVANAAVRVEPNAPLWAFSTMVRADQNEILLNKYNRALIAALPPDMVDRLYSILKRAMAHALESIAHHDQEFSQSNERRVFPTIVELLSRLSIRLSAEQNDALFELAVTLYKLPLELQAPGGRQKVEPLFKRLLGQAMGRTQIMGKLGTLLSLPLPGEANLVNPSPIETWPEPMYEIRPRERNMEAPLIDTSGWRISIEHLLQALGTSEKAARANAALRLMVLYEWNLLNREQTEAFAAALWNQTSNDTGLPADTVFTKAAFLLLPELYAGQAQTAFRKYVAGTSIPRTYTRSLSSDGKTIQTALPTSDQNRFVVDVVQSTLPPRADAVNRARLITWSREEAESLLQKARSWWLDEQSDLNNKPADFGGMIMGIADTVRGQLSGLVDLLGIVILPTIRESDSDVKEVAINLVKELLAAKFAVQSALPRQLLIKPELLDEVVGLMRSGLVSTDETVVRQSIIGLFFWLLDVHDLAAPAPPPDLLQEWVNKITSRRQPALPTALGQMAQLIKALPEAVAAEQCTSICIGLSYLAEETALPAWTDQLGVQAENPNTMFAVQERPSYRRYAATLAAALEEYYRARKEPLPSVIERWRELSRIDPLPEVRRAFSVPG